MNIPNQSQPSPAVFQDIVAAVPLPGRTWLSSFTTPFLAVLTLLAGILVSPAATLVLNANDGGGTSSLTTPLTGAAAGWVATAGTGGGVAAQPGTNYTAAFILRTPAATTSGNNYIFQGDSLSINAGGRLLGKFGNNGAVNNVSNTITITNLILNGGYMDSAGGSPSVDNEFMTVTGNITVNAASGIGALGETTSSFETLNITAPISGSATLAVSGSTVNAGADTGLVQLSAANPYSGTITVSNGVIANPANGLLQLNNLNALSNAMLKVSSVLANPMSFASGANTGAFNVGALAGQANLTLDDTAGSPVTLSVGGNNSSSIYTGALTDTGNGGNLIKVGSGIQTLAGKNTYTGTTTVSGGTLALGGGGSISNTLSITVSQNATFDVSAVTGGFTLSASQNLLGGGTNNGSIGTMAGSMIYADSGAGYATNTFNNNLTLVSGAVAYFNVGTVHNGSSDFINISGSLTNNGAVEVSAPSTSVNLDTTGDYVLITSAGGISGTVSSTPLWGVKPLNSANYTIVQNGNSIKLHYAPSAPPAGTLSVTPNPATRDQGVVITVTVTSSSHPISTVTANAASLGGSPSLSLISAGNNT
jgi:autotransporter-associated beta strand protein